MWNENELVGSTHHLETGGKDKSEHETKGTHQTGDCRHGKSDQVARDCRRRDELGHGKEATK